MKKVLLTESDAGFTEWFADLRAKQARAIYDIENLKKQYEEASKKLENFMTYHERERELKWKEVLELAKKLGKVHPDVCLEEVTLEVRSEKPYKLYISEKKSEEQELAEIVGSLLSKVKYNEDAN